MIKIQEKSWPKFLRAIKDTVSRSLLKSELKDCIIDMLYGTDEFHPSGTEYEYSDLTKEYFETVTEAKEELEEVLRAMVDEIQEKIVEYYGNDWNFPPEEQDTTKIKITFKKNVGFKSVLKQFVFKKVKGNFETISRYR